MEGYDRLLDIAWEKEQKLKDELDTLKKSFETATWELGNQVAKKESLLVEKQARLAKIEAQLAQTEGLLWATEEKARIA